MARRPHSLVPTNPSRRQRTMECRCSSHASDGRPTQGFVSRHRTRRPNGVVPMRSQDGAKAGWTSLVSSRCRIRHQRVEAHRKRSPGTNIGLAESLLAYSSPAGRRTATDRTGAARQSWSIFERLKDEYRRDQAYRIESDKEDLFRFYADAGPLHYRSAYVVLFIASPAPCRN